MTIARTAAIVAFSLLMCSSTASAAEQLDVPKSEIIQLINDLGNPSFRVRQNAQRALLKTGTTALPALREATNSSDPEVLCRVRKLVKALRTHTLYTISRDGRLFRVTVRERSFQTTQLAKLGPPFDQPNVRTEGLAMCSQGMLYASVVFQSKQNDESRLCRVDPRTGAIEFIGRIAAAEVDGLDFSPDGRLYGVISSSRRSSATSLTQLIEIDLVTGKASPTTTQVALTDLDALAIDGKGRAIMANGSCGLYRVPLNARSTAEPFLTSKSFRHFLRVHDEMEGLCDGQDGVLFGVCHECCSFLVRIDVATRSVTCITGLEFGALNLAAAVPVETANGSR